MPAVHGKVNVHVLLSAADVGLAVQVPCLPPPHHLVVMIAGTH